MQQHPSPPSVPAPDAHQFAEDIRDILGVLRRGWRVIAITVVVCLTLAALYLAGATRLYQATAQVLVLQHGGRPFNVGGNDPTAVLERDDDLMATHALVLSSPMIVSRAIDTIGLKGLPTLSNTQNPVKQAIELLKITRPDRTAKILQIAYRAGSGGEAVRMVEAITRSYEQFLAESYQKNNNEVVALITKARDEITRDIDRLQQEYLRFHEESQVLTADESGRTFIARRLDQWDRAASDAMIKATRLRFQLDLAKQLESDGIGLMAMAHAMQQLGDDTGSLANFASLSAQGISSDYLRQLVQEQQQLAERYGPQYSKVRELQEQIDRVKQTSSATRSQLDKAEIDGMVRAIEQSLGQIEAMREEFRSRFTEDLAQARQAESDRLKEMALRTNLERHQALFNTIVEQLKQAQFTSDFTSISAQTIEPANARPVPVQPRTTLTLVLALMVGMLAGCGFVIVADRLDRRIRSLEELRATLRSPVLGEVLKAADGQVPDTCDYGRIAQSLPRSAWAEAYRAARTNLDFLRRSRRLQVLLVTSPNPGDGKSSTASNLAISMAQAGRRVLLIDADLRKPSQHTIHGLPVRGGLTRALGAANREDGLAVSTSVEGLDLVPAGPEVPSPAELLASGALGGLLERLRGAYDTIVIDSPPLLAVADPAIIAAVADGIILVVRATALRHDEARRALDVIEATGTAFVGVVINAIDRVRDGYGYGYGYGYGHGYGGNGTTTHRAGSEETAPPDHDGRSRDEGLAPHVNGRAHPSDPGHTNF